MDIEVAEADVALQTGQVINYSGHLSAPTGKYPNKQNSIGNICRWRGLQT